MLNHCDNEKSEVEKESINKNILNNNLLKITYFNFFLYPFHSTLFLSIITIMDIIIT